MKVGDILIVLALTFLMATLCLAQEKPGDGAPNGSPKLVIPSFTHDFGEVKPGTALKYSFVFKNQGKSDLLIQSVTPS